MMKKYVYRPPVVEAMTFEDLVQYGLRQPTVNVVEGMPWSFKVKGFPVTHENDSCYLVGTPVQKFTPLDMLVFDKFSQQPSVINMKFFFQEYKLAKDEDI